MQYRAPKIIISLNGTISAMKNEDNTNPLNFDVLLLLLLSLLLLPLNRYKIQTNARRISSIRVLLFSLVLSLNSFLGLQFPYEC